MSAPIARPRAAVGASVATPSECVILAAVQIALGIRKARRDSARRFLKLMNQGA